MEKAMGKKEKQYRKSIDHHLYYFTGLRIIYIHRHTHIYTTEYKTLLDLIRAFGKLCGSFSSSWNTQICIHRDDFVQQFVKSICVWSLYAYEVVASRLKCSTKEKCHSVDRRAKWIHQMWIDDALLNWLYSEVRYFPFFRFRKITLFRVEITFISFGIY